MSAKFMVDFPLGPATTAGERRAAFLRAEQERADQRRRELDSQSAPTNAPQERIMIWERLHGLRLPQSARHPLVAVIARQTQLTTRAINDEQERRRDLSKLEREGA